MSNLNAALEYLKAGYPVIPCNAEKQALVKWQFYQDRLPTEKEVKKWFAQFPDANIAVVTNNLAVIDLDDPDKAKQILNDLIPDSLVFPVARTPRGGEHWFFRCNDSSIRNNSKIIPGADLRANGGYVLVAPSRTAKGKYEWLNGMTLPNAELPPLPDTYVTFVTSVTQKGVSNLNSNINNTLPYRGVTDLLQEMFNEGRRDDSIFHVANCLEKGGMPETELRQVVVFIANNCNPPFPEKDAMIKVDSVLRRKNTRDRQIMGEMKEWIELQAGYFSVTSCYSELQMLQVREKTAARVALKRLCDDGIIQRHPSKSGIYRKPDTALNEIAWQEADGNRLALKWPFQIESLFEAYPKNIALIAGSPDSGKTAFLLNFIKLNMHKHTINLFSSEMGARELKLRLSKFDIPESEWRFKAYERAADFADVIKANEINVIDYLEIHEEHYRVGSWIKQIFDRLENGIALIALQKKPGANTGVGGMTTLEKPRLYLSMEGGRIAIEKCKNWVDPMTNPNGLEAEYKLVKGCEFIVEKSWRKVNEKT